MPRSAASGDGGAPSSTAFLPQFSSFATMYDAGEDVDDVEQEIADTAPAATTTRVTTLGEDEDEDEAIVADEGTAAGRMYASAGDAPSAACEVRRGVLAR